MTLQLTQVAMMITATVPCESIERHVAADPRVIGEQLAEQVILYESKHKLGYYPALDFFLENGGLDSELLQALDSLSWVVAGMVRNEIRMRMRPVFSRLIFENIQLTAYTIPAVRPHQPNARKELAVHFTGVTVKTSLIATLIQKFINSTMAEKMAASMARRWLENRFEKLEISGVRTVC